MLIYEEDSDILAFDGEAIEGSLYRRVVGFGINNKEVLLRVWGLRDMLVYRLVSIVTAACREAHSDACKQHARHRVLGSY